MTFEFRPAVRQNVPLLIGLAGGTGSGKTMSAMILAKGLAHGKPFYVIDTENGRALHYADQFDFLHTTLEAPFRPERYADAIDAAISDAKQDRPVVVVDSFSHEHAGEGGLLDWHEEEFQRMGGRDNVKMAAWIKPKMAHKAMVNRLLQVGAHLILCFRAEQKIEIVKNAQGKTEIVPKQSLVGLDGWVPISEKTLPYELTASFLLTADAPGVPKPVKLQEQHRPFFPLDRPISEAAGVALGEWAAGGVAEPDAGVVAENSIPEGGAQNSGQQPLPNEPVERVSGSVTPWAQLCNLAATAGVDEAVFVATKKEMFPDRRSASLTDEECVALWATIEERVEAGVDA